MIGFIKRLIKDRRGNALVLAGAALPLMIGSAGLATDTIQWTVMKRQLQRAADSAALAGVYGKLASQNVATGACSASAPISRDLTVGNINGRIGASPTCNAYTSSDIDDPNWTAASFSAVQVKLQTTRPLAFSGLFMSSPPIIRASAIAAVVQSGKYCVVSLDNKAEIGLSFSGNATVNLGCGLKTNAKGPSAVSGTGSSSVLASPVAAVGQIANSGTFAAGTTLQPYSSPQPDPFAAVNAPASTTFPNGNCPNFRVNSNTMQSTLVAGVDYKPTTDGYYCVNSMTLSGTVNLPSGVYVIDGGDLSIGAQANVTCNGCTFILTNRSTSSTPIVGSVNVNGGATVNMSNSTSGTYSGLLFYQDRRATVANGNGQSNLINGNSSSSYQGSMYFPSTAMTFNGTSGMSTACVQLVAWQVAFSGNTSISNVCPSGGPRSFDGSMVRLVG